MKKISEFDSKTSQRKEVMRFDYNRLRIESIYLLTARICSFKLTVRLSTLPAATLLAARRAIIYW